MDTAKGKLGETIGLFIGITYRNMDEGLATERKRTQKAFAPSMPNSVGCRLTNVRSL